LSSYGIPLKQHPEPEMRAKARALAVIQREYRAEEARHNAAFRTTFSALEEQGLSGDYDAFDTAFAPVKVEHDAVLAGLRTRTGLVTRDIPTNLYRVYRDTVSIRFDKVGKAAWDAEYLRLHVECPGSLQAPDVSSRDGFVCGFVCPSCKAYLGRYAGYRVVVHIPGFNSGTSILVSRLVMPQKEASK